MSLYNIRVIKLQATTTNRAMAAGVALQQLFDKNCMQKKASCLQVLFNQPYLAFWVDYRP